MKFKQLLKYMVLLEVTIVKMVVLVKFETFYSTPLEILYFK